MAASRESKRSPLPLIAAAVVVIALAVVLVPRFVGGGAGTALLQAQDHAKSFGNGEDVVIKASDIKSDASYYDYDANGTTVQLMAVKASDGTARVALNTCQVCNGSPKAYFVQDGDNFICQNCKNVFPSAAVGNEAQGCDPIPVTSSDYKLSSDSITVPASFLDQYAGAFTNWKKA